MPTIAELAAAARRRAAGEPEPIAPPPPAPAPAPAPLPAGLVASGPTPQMPVNHVRPTFAPPSRKQDPPPLPVTNAPAPVVSQPAAVNTGDISTRALLVTLSVRMWGGTKTDKKVSGEVRHAKQAKEGAGRYIKNLIPDDYIDPLKAISQAAGDDNRRMSSQWGPGQRIIKAEVIEDWLATMRKHKEDWEPAVAHLLDNYDQMLIDAESNLGAMFNRREYPTRTQLERRYSFDFDVTNVPTADDFRVSLPNIDRDRLKAEMEASQRNKAREVNREIAARIEKAVAHMAERLRAYKGTREGSFRDTLTANVQELADLVPMLNVTGDPAIDAIAAAMKADLCGIAPDVLRDSERTRENVAEKADAILKDVSALLA